MKDSSYAYPTNRRWKVQSSDVCFLLNKERDEWLHLKVWSWAKLSWAELRQANVKGAAKGELSSAYALMEKWTKIPPIKSMVDMEP